MVLVQALVQQGLSRDNLHRFVPRSSHITCYDIILTNDFLLSLNVQRVSIVGSLRDREVACSASDRQDSNFESCVWRTVSSQSSHHPQEVLLAQFSLYVHKGGLKPDSFHLNVQRMNNEWNSSSGLQCSDSTSNNVKSILSLISLSNHYINRLRVDLDVVSAPLINKMGDKWRGYVSLKPKLK